MSTRGLAGLQKGVGVWDISMGSIAGLSSLHLRRRCKAVGTTIPGSAFGGIRHIDFAHAHAGRPIKTAYRCAISLHGLLSYLMA
jgi:hypothetical protein